MPVFASKHSATTCMSSAIGLRAAPPVTPECWSVVPVSSVKSMPCSPRRPAGAAGLPRAIQIVSETMIESVASLSLANVMPFAKLGEPISSSNSHRKRTFTGTPASNAAFAPKSAESAGPLSSVVPRPK